MASLSLFTFMHWRRKWQPTPVFLPGESHEQRSLVGYCPWGSQTNTAAAAAAKSLQSCPTLCDPIDGRLPHPWDSPDKNTGVGCHFLLQCMKVKNESEVTQSCPTLSDPMDCSTPGSFIHGIFQARVLEWVAIAFSYCMSNRGLTVLELTTHETILTIL